VHERIVKNIYGREAGLEVLPAMQDSPALADKKALTARAFVAQIEAIMETQMARRAALMDPPCVRARPQH
jgi:paired amphipathic helix protein Sin3a